MTPEEHNKYVGYAHLGYGALSALLIMALTLFVALTFGAAFFFDPKFGRNPAPFVIVIFFVVMSLLVSLVFSLPSLIAGYGHLKNKSWAKIWTLIASVLCASSMPFGTLVAVYSLWFTFGDEGRKFYEAQERQQSTEQYKRSLNDATIPFGWSANEQTEKREYDFKSPYQPPNWRE